MNQPKPVTVFRTLRPIPRQTPFSQAMDTAKAVLKDSPATITALISAPVCALVSEWVRSRVLEDIATGLLIIGLVHFGVLCFQRRKSGNP